MKSHFVLIQIRFILFLTFASELLALKYKVNDDVAHGLRISVNHNYTIAAFNGFHTYVLRFLPPNFDIECSMDYHTRDIFVYSLSALTMKPDSTQFSFIQIGENTTSQDAILSIVTSNISCCKAGLRPSMMDRTVWTNGHQESILLKTDLDENYAYVFAESFVFSYDLKSNDIVEFYNGTFFAGNEVNFIPTAVDLTNEWGLVVGYNPAQRFGLDLAVFYPIRIQPKMSSICPYAYDSDDLDRIFQSLKSSDTAYNPNHGISLSIDPSRDLLAASDPSENSVCIYRMSDLKNCALIPATNGLIRPVPSINKNQKIVLHSVVWLDNQGTLGVLVHISERQAETKSEIHVFKNIVDNAYLHDVRPEFVLPNNQQTFESLPKASFVRIFAHANNMLVLRDDHKYMYIPSVGEGNISTLIERNCSGCMARPALCVSGTYKDAPSVGPCTACPPNTKNPGLTSATYCQPCHSTSFCSRGSTDDVNLADFSSYSQTFSYPNSPLIDNYDDLLILNFLNIDSSLHCMLASPLFWTAVAIILCFIVWLVMFLIKIRRLGNVHKHRKRLKLVLMHIDLIGEGERWVGGLASLVIVILAIFSCWFANDFFHAYPNETAKTYRKGCTNNQLNTKFGNALQLPLPVATGNYWKIFHMLNHQKFSMTIDLINTKAICNGISIERIRHMGTPKRINKTKCIGSIVNPGVSFSFNLHNHTDTIKVEITGPYFIGAIRLCLRGPADFAKEKTGFHRLQGLDMCTLFYTDNQTLSLSTNFEIRLVKVVNLTEPLVDRDQIVFDGRWAPNIQNIDDLSDELYFEKDGQYLRYISNMTYFTMQFKEESYFIENIQSPIIRRRALVFHTLLFFSLLIDIVGTIFLIFKLCCFPLLNFVTSFQKQSFKSKQEINDIQETVKHITQQIQSQESETLLMAENEKSQRKVSMMLNPKAEIRQSFNRCASFVTRLQPSRGSATTSNRIVQNPREMLAETTNGSVSSSSNANIEHLLQFFDKQLHVHYDDNEQSHKTIDMLQNQMEELKKQNSDLWQRLTYIEQVQKEQTKH